jgi:cytochrome c oxidase assembly protein subunit 15
VSPASRRLPRLSPTAYRKITFVAGVLLAIIIITGGAVRLTQSGLGCSDWPNCSPGHLVPHGASDSHGWVEYTNRLFTGAVSFAVIIAVLGSLARVPRRRDLVWLSVGLVIGVLAQIVLGALAVAFDLAPPFVMAHFLVSLALLANAIVLHKRAGESDGPARLQVAPRVKLLGRALLLAAACVVVSGTVVTSTGPHGGDAKAKRFDLYLPHVARVHGSFVILFLGLTLVTLWYLRRTRAPIDTVHKLGLLFAVSVAQGALGYYQYFNGIPALAVGFHIAGATAVWAATVNFYLGLFTRPAEVLVETPDATPRRLSPTPTPA